MIPRLFITEARFYSREYIKPAGIDAFLSSKNTISEVIERYKLVFHGLLLQEEGTTTLHLVTSGEEIILVKSYTEYCRWHNGPLEERDNPLEREYCIREAVGELGYCNVHRNSLRAIYTKCFGSGGLNSIRNCWILDEKLRGKVEYVVYMLAYSMNKFKVGSTRLWRIYERIGEQPHVVATILYKSNSAVKTREVEVKAGKLEGLTEHPRRKLHETLSTPIPPTITRFKKIVEKTRRILGLRDTDYKVFRVEPSRGIEYFYKAREVTLENLYSKPLILLDYYAGYMLVEERSSNTRYLVKTNKILHTSSIKLVR